MLTLSLLSNVSRPRMKVCTRAKKDFVEPAEAPGEGKRRPPSPEDEMHPIKKLIMDVFKIKEIDYEEFKKSNKWAIRPKNKNKE